MLLEQIGLQFEIEESEYEEDMKAKKDPHELAEFLAEGKAMDVAKNHSDAIVIGADTFDVLDGKLIGKPKSNDDAKTILKNLSGNEHIVITGYCIVDTSSGKKIKGHTEAKVKFQELSDTEIENYIKEENVLDLAGGYAIQSLAAKFIEEISGDYYAIAGLSLNKVYKALRELGVNI